MSASRITFSSCVAAADFGAKLSAQQSTHVTDPVMTWLPVVLHPFNAHLCCILQPHDIAVARFDEWNSLDASADVQLWLNSNPTPFKTSAAQRCHYHEL